MQCYSDKYKQKKKRIQNEIDSNTYQSTIKMSYKIYRSVKHMSLRLRFQNHHDYVKIIFQKNV